MWLKIPRTRDQSPNSYDHPFNRCMSCLLFSRGFWMDSNNSSVIHYWVLYLPYWPFFSSSVRMQSDANSSIFLVVKFCIFAIRIQEICTKERAKKLIRTCQHMARASSYHSESLTPFSHLPTGKIPSLNHRSFNLLERCAEDLPYQSVPFQLYYNLYPDPFFAKIQKSNTVDGAHRCYSHDVVYILIFISAHKC